MIDREPVKPWVPDGITTSSKTTSDGCEITVTGNATGWLYPPTPKPAGLAKVVWEKQDGTFLIGIYNYTVEIFPGVTVLTRLCGYEDASLVTMLKTANLPLVFAAADHPY